MVNLVFLPATDPGDETFGMMPNQIPDYPDAALRQVCYPTMVWYNESIRQEAIAQIRRWDVSRVVLIGFSKSGLGAWNIAREIPDRISATIIFDAPVARDQLPPWGTKAFYTDDAAWQKDLPLRTVEAFAAAVTKAHRLVLIPGNNFRNEMRALSQALSQIKHEHIFLDCPEMRHHWNSGWIEKGLNELLESGRGE
jgi:pimeloyl-ACP methyl ester carboxylesterase